MDENDEGDINDVARQADIRTEIEARRRARFGPPMTVDATQELHTAAQDHQDQLTQEERQSPSNPVLRPVPAPTLFPSSSNGPVVRPLRVVPYPSVPVPGPESRRVRLQSAFMVFANEQRERVRGENPDLTLGRVGKLMGDRWQAMSAEERAPYEARAVQAQ